MRLISVFVLIALWGLTQPTAAYEDQFSEMEIEHLSDRVIIVQTAAGYPRQMAVKTNEGLVVFGTLYDLDLTRKYRRLIEQEFGRNDFRYVICTSARILDHGGTAAYPEATLIAHSTVKDAMSARQGKLDELIAREIRVFTTKSSRSRGILAEDPPNPDANQNQYNWMVFCQNIVDSLEKGSYEERLPDKVFTQNHFLELGDCPIELIDFGPGYHSNYLLINLPSEGLLLDGGFSPLHMAPMPGPDTDATSVQLWLKVLDDLLEKNKNIQRVYCGVSGSMDMEDLVLRRDYIRDLWTAVKTATEEGIDLETARERLSLDGEFAHLRSLPIYTNNSEEWVSWDHNIHLDAYWRYQHECAAQAIEDALAASGLAAAEARFREMKNYVRHRYYFQENRFNDLGYKLMNDGNLPAAVAVFGMNVEAHPESGNAHDSLGESLLKAGKKEAAMHMYSQALELDPENANARRVLEEHGAIETH